LLALLSMLFWGMSYVWSKKVFTVLDPAETVFLRLIISVPVLLLIILITNSWQTIKKKHIPLFLASAVFNPFLYFIGESYGLQNVTPTISAVIIATIPVFTPVVAWFMLKERLRPIHISGLIISIIGVLLIMNGNQDTKQDVSVVGVLFLFGAVATAVIQGVMLRKLTLHYNPLMIITFQNFVGIFLFLPLALLTGNHLGNLLVIPNEIWIYLVLLGIFASSLAFVFYTRTVQAFGLSRASLYTNLIPVFTAIFSFFILNEVPGAEKIGGMFLVIFGVILTQYTRKGEEIVPS
jgi:drug/metabolite transporter (DMT)-like permease